MKHLNGEYYVEIKDHRFKIRPTENIVLRKRDPSKSLRTQYQVLNETQVRKIQKVIKNDNDELVGKNYPKKKQTIQQPKLNHRVVLVVNRIIGWNLIKVTVVKFVNMLSTKRNIKLQKKVLRQDLYFSTRLPYANKKIGEILFYG